MTSQSSSPALDSAPEDLVLGLEELDLAPEIVGRGSCQHEQQSLGELMHESILTPP